MINSPGVKGIKMGRQFSLVSLASLIIALGASGLSSTPAEAAEQQSSAITHDELSAAIITGYDALRAGDLATAKAMFNTARAAPQFSSLDRTTQHFVLANLSYSLLGLQEFNDALEPTRKTTEFKEATAQDWQRRLNLSAILKDKDDVAISLTALASSWPKTLSQISFEAIGRATSAPRHGGPNDDVRFKLLQALYTARWTPEDPAFTADYQWSEFAELLLKRGDVGQARIVYRDITSSMTLIRMASDKRFDAITQGDANTVDISSAINTELVKVRTLVEATPRKLKTTNRLAAMLLYRNQSEEALNILDAAIEKVRAGGSDPFDDMNEYNWTLNERAWALKQLGRIDEAISEEARAARKAENGGTNVSQLINLAGTYNDAKRPKDALLTLEDLDFGRTSPYGQMEALSVKACAYAQLDNRAKYTEIIEQMRSKGTASPSRLIDAELCGKNIEAAAKRMIAALENTEERSEMLVAVQDYLPSRGRNAHQAELESRFKTLIARPDVQAALSKVGRVGTYAIRLHPY